VKGRVEDCDRGPGCEPVWAITSRLDINSGAIASIARSGVEVYRDETTLSALSRIAAKQAGKAQAHVAGVITDTDGHALSRVVVSTDAPVRAAITNDSGYFEIRTLPVKQVGLSVKKAGYASLSFRLPLVADSTRHVRLSLVAIPGKER
jgi:hypothetical protein